MQTRKIDFPRGWVITTIGEISDINERDKKLRVYSDDMLVTFIPMAAINAEMGVINKPQSRPIGKVKRGFTSFSNGDVLLAKITPCLENGKAAIAKDLVNGIGFGSTEFHILRPKDSVLSAYLYYFIRQESFRWDAKASFTGTAGQLRVPRSFVINYPIPLPPLPEQERIVERIESLFTQLDAGVAGLKRVQSALKRDKASLLNSTFKGEPGWSWKRLGDITPVLRGASPRPKGDPKYYGGTIPWIKISDITRESGKYLTTTVDTVTPEGVKKSKYLIKGSLILSICATVCVPKILKIDGCVHDGFVYFPELPDEIDKIFLYYYFESIRSQVIQENRQGMTQVNLNTGIVSNFNIPILSFTKQQSIVSDLESRLSVVHELEQTIEANLKRAARLRQAILKRAFEGRLLCT